MAYTSAGYNLNVTAANVQTTAGTNESVNTNQADSFSWGAGTSAGQADQVVNANRTVPSSGSKDTINLTTILNTIGAAAGFLHVGLLEIINNDPTNTITFGAGATHGVGFLPAATGGIALSPGAKFLIAWDQVPGGSNVAGPAVVASTSDQIDVSTGGGTNVSYTVSIIGRDA